MQSKDGKTAVLSFDNGDKVIISKQNSDGTTDSEVYNFKAVTDETVFPPVPDLPNYWHDVDLDKWNGVIDSNFKDSLNSNSDQIQKSINSLYEYETDQRNFFAKAFPISGIAVSSCQKDLVCVFPVVCRLLQFKVVIRSETAESDGCTAAGRSRLQIRKIVVAKTGNQPEGLFGGI